MGFITWNDHYSVKVQEIDDQHKKLIALANQLYDAMRSGKGRDVLGPVLTELVEYTAYHFESEERLMLQHDYPEHDEHKEQHDSLAEKARQFRDDFRQVQESRTMDVMLFLSNWLNVHILEVDKRYATFLSDKGVRELQGKCNGRGRTMRRGGRSLPDPLERLARHSFGDGMYTNRQVDESFFDTTCDASWPLS